MREPRWIINLRALLSDARVWAAIFAAFGLGGYTGNAAADDGVTAGQVDSAVKAEILPLKTKQARQDTALIGINFKLDVMMSDDQKRRADSLMRTALKNINYGGSP